MLYASGPPPVCPQVNDGSFVAGLVKIGAPWSEVRLKH